MPERFAWLAVAVLATAATARAQVPEAKKHAYDIGPEAGAWCICVTSYFENIDLRVGRDFRPGELDQLLARSKARQLAIEFVEVLRRDFLLPAYMFNRGDEERKKEEERVTDERQKRKALYEKIAEEQRQRKDVSATLAGAEIHLPPRANYKRLAHVQDQYIVVIGGYQDQEGARRSLDAIRKLEFPKEKYKHLMNTIVAGLGGPAETGPATRDKAQGHGMYVNPFKTSMVLPNPTGPKIKPPMSDPVELARGLAELNADNPYSLLKHGGKVTLVVKKYQIPTRVTGLGERSDARQASSNNSGKIYDATAKQAEQLAAFLRHPQLNFDSYVLHTLAGSMVTVGIFNSEQDPRLQTVQRSLSSLKLQTNGGVEQEQLMNPALPIPIPKGR